MVVLCRFFVLSSVVLVSLSFAVILSESYEIQRNKIQVAEKTGTGKLFSPISLFVTFLSTPCRLDLLSECLPTERICRTAGTMLAVCLEPFAHRQNVASLRLFNRYYLGRYLSKLAELVPLPCSCRKSTLCSNRLHDLFVTISKGYKE